MIKKKETTEHTSVKQNRLVATWKQFCKNKGAMIGLFITLTIILIAVFSDIIWDYNADVIKMNIPEKFTWPCLAHPFGTDEYGRDMLARVGYGAKYSLIIGVSAVVVGMVIGIPVGASAGYVGGRYDAIVMRVVDAFGVIPSILLSITIVAAFGTSMFNLAIALSVGTIPILARTTRAAVMTVRFNEYIESAHAIGASPIYIVFKHVLPNCFSSILVQCTLQVGAKIIGASSLSYIGLGVALPTPEWGALLSSAKDHILKAPYLCFFPGLAIMITVMAINLVGDGLRDALDPKMKR